MRAWARRQARLLKEMPAMLLRMLPLVANPLPPPFGLVLLALANTLPRTFLTRHYYSDAQMVLARAYTERELSCACAMQRRVASHPRSAALIACPF